MIALAAALAYAGRADLPIAPVQLLTEYLPSPVVGVDTTVPRFRCVNIDNRHNTNANRVSRRQCIPAHRECDERLSRRLPMLTTFRLQLGDGLAKQGNNNGVSLTCHPPPTPLFIRRPEWWWWGGHRIRGASAPRAPLALVCISRETSDHPPIDTDLSPSHSRGGIASAALTSSW